MTQSKSAHCLTRLLLVSSSAILAIACSAVPAPTTEGSSPEPETEVDNTDTSASQSSSVGGSTGRGGASTPSTGAKGGASAKGGATSSAAGGSDRTSNAGGASGSASNVGGSVRNQARGGSDNGGDSGSAGSTVPAAGAGGSLGRGGSGRGRGGSVGTGGAAGTSQPGATGGSLSAGGSRSTGGSTGTGGSVGTGGTTSTSNLEPFSFFVTSMKAIKTVSNNQNGFGGDLRFGKADGLSGADEICRQIAEMSMPGSSTKQWRAFLSVTKGPAGTAVNAIDRVGEGPWYDRLGRLVAKTKADLAQGRPKGADTAIINDLPNESGVPNHNPDNTGQVDNHDTLTGSDSVGKLYKTDWSCTCHDWTSSVGSDGKPRVGHTWPRGSGAMAHWISALDEAGCAAGMDVVEKGGPIASNPTVGSGGGYGGFYCLALSP